MINSYVRDRTVAEICYFLNLLKRKNNYDFTEISLTELLELKDKLQEEWTNVEM